MAPAYNIAHANEDDAEDCPEVVGSKDLRESFKERGRIRGGFSINGHEFHQFETNSIDNLVALLNGRSAYTHVRASIDDGYHLVLEANSPAPISIRQGDAFIELPPAAGSGNVADEVIQKLKTAADKDADKGDDGKPKNTILEDLGLTATDDAEVPAVGATHPGPSAEDRKKARDERKEAVATGSSPSAGTAGQTNVLPTDQSSPITGSGDGAKMADGRDRTGQGAGYSAKPDGTPAVAGTPAREAAEGAIHDPAANVPHRPDPQPL